jgi:hypothetical protein
VKHAVRSLLDEEQGLKAKALYPWGWRLPEEVVQQRTGWSTGAMRAILAVCMKPNPKDRKITCGLPRRHKGRACSWQLSQSRALLLDRQQPAQGEMLVRLLRAFAQRTAIDNRANLRAAYGRLRLLNTLARQIVSAQAGKRKHASFTRRSRHSHPIAREAR